MIKAALGNNEVQGKYLWTKTAGEMFLLFKYFRKLLSVKMPLYIFTQA